jgi:hypothetical protein
MMRDIGIFRNFTLCEMNKVHLILNDTFFEILLVDVRRKQVWLW